MGDDLGRLSGHARGRVLPGEVIESVLAMVPEQTWAWDEEMDVGGGGMVDVTIEVPMALRREIVAQVLLAPGVMDLG